MTGVFILSHIEKYASISFFTENCFPVKKKTLREDVICPLSSRQVKYLKLNVDDACISF